MSDTQPLDFPAAVALARRSAEAQKAAEQAVRDASTDLAEKERLYRKSLATAIVEQHAGGSAWTVAQDLARGTPTVADLRYERDVAKGVLEAAQQRSFRHMADRRDVLQFVLWSRQCSVAELSGRTEPEPDWSHRPIGGKAP